MLAPREYSGAPFTRKNMPWVPVSFTCPVALALALLATTVALVSLTVTRAKTRNPSRRDVAATTVCTLLLLATGDDGVGAVDALEVHVALTLYRFWSPTPFGLRKKNVMTSSDWKVRSCQHTKW